MHQNENHPFPFSWSLLENAKEGREHLGNTMPVAVYRLFEYTMRDAVSARYGASVCNEIFRDAGYLAGKNFYERFLRTAADLNDLLLKWQTAFSELKMGIVRVEHLQDNGDAMITVSEDLDCSGLPVIGSTVCHYDEGFIAGVLNAFTNRPYTAKEIDCWAKGDRVCRFHVKAGD